MRTRLLLACLVGLATPALAQQPSAPAEIGFDASIMHISAKSGGVTESATVSLLPMQSIRLTIPATPYVSFEPALSVLSISSGGDSHTSFSGELAALIHFTPDRKMPQFFVRPAVGWSKDALFEFAAGSRASAGVGLGARIPANDHVAFRIEGRYRHGFEDKNVSINSFGLVAGMSFSLK